MDDATDISRWGICDLKTNPEFLAAAKQRILEKLTQLWAHGAKCDCQACNDMFGKRRQP